MDRAQVRRPERALIERAAQTAQTRIGGASGIGSSSGGSTPIGREVTSEGVDGNGDIFTKHPMIWGLDKFGDPASLWSKP